MTLLTCYPTYGYKRVKDATWQIPVLVWAHRDRDILDWFITHLEAIVSNLSRSEGSNFKDRIADLIADDISGEAVSFVVDSDPRHAPCQVTWTNGARTDVNGLIEGIISLPEARAIELLNAQKVQSGWLNFTALCGGSTCAFRVRLLEPAGTSVVSDIDDTIKITEIPAGKEIVARNTFFRDFVAVPGAAGSYRDLGGVSFHYVSGSPWQLYQPLADFLIKGIGGFPEGTFHMKTVDKNLRSVKTWEELHTLVEDSFDLKEETRRQKVQQISDLMTNLPGRRFILIGDSGERDPEAYKDLRDRFGQQVAGIRIRDVVNAPGATTRFDGMDVTHANTIRPGVSQFGS